MYLLPPVRVYSGRVYVFDDVATMEVSNRQITTDTIGSKLVNLRAMVVAALLCKEIEDPQERGG